MSEQPPEVPPQSMLERMREKLVPDSMPEDDRGRMRRVLDSLILHLQRIFALVTVILAVAFMMIAMGLSTIKRLR